MKDVYSIQLVAQSNEEILPDYAPDFPYIASRSNMSRYFGSAAPWHWHSAVELFYVRSGGIAYHTPGGVHSFLAGSGGIINRNVLHASSNIACQEETVLVLHLFDPVLLSGGEDSRIYRRYVQEHLTEAMRVEDLAEAAHVSKRVCFRLFQEKLQVSPVEYIRSLRFQEACRLLATTKEPITQVGYVCGLGSASYFGQVFRQRLGCTPAEYRRKMARS